MRNFKITISMFFLMTAIKGTAQYNHENLKIKCGDNFGVNDSTPAHFDNSYAYNHLKLFPIVANQAFMDYNKDLGKFTLLKEAIEKGKIIITETGATNIAEEQQIQNVNQSSNSNPSGTVNTLFAKNVSNDTIFIMAGEVVKGGKQDRVIGQDVVIVPGQEINLSAFCVEHGRWQTTNGNQGQFNGYFNVSSMDIRKIVTEDKNQQGVWNKVDEHTGKNNAGSATQTYTNLANSAEYQKQVSAYMEKFKDAFQNNPNVIGFIAVTGNQVIGCDLFATHQLFIDSYSNLLYSYIGHAITNGAPVTITNEQVYTYLDQILRSEKDQKETIEQNGTIYEYKSKKLHMTKY